MNAASRVLCPPPVLRSIKCRLNCFNGCSKWILSRNWWGYWVRWRLYSVHSFPTDDWKWFFYFLILAFHEVSLWEAGCLRLLFVNPGVNAIDAPRDDVRCLFYTLPNNLLLSPGRVGTALGRIFSLYSTLWFLVWPSLAKTIMNCILRIASPTYSF